MWDFWVYGKQFESTVMYHSLLRLLNKLNSHAQTYPGAGIPGCYGNRKGNILNQL